MTNLPAANWWPACSRCVAAVLAAALLLLVQHSAANGQPPAVDLEFELSAEQSLPTVPVRLAGQTYEFILDTGAETTVYDRIIGSPLGEVRESPVNSPKSSTGTRLAQFVQPRAQLGGLSLDDGTLKFCFDLQLMRDLHERPYCGIVGLDFLRKHIVQFDFDAGMTRLLSRLPDDPGEPFPFAADPLHRAAVVGTPGRLGGITFLLDSGSDGSIGIETSLHRDLLRVGRLTHVQPAGQITAGGIVDSTSARLNSFRVGAFAHDRLVTYSGSHNILGMRYLSRFLVTIDYPRQQVYLKKRSTFAEPDRRDVSGLWLIRTGGQTIVDNVAPFSPGIEAGLQPDDVLLSINGRDIARRPLTGIRRLLEDEGVTLSVSILRNGQPMETTLALREYRLAKPPRY